MQTNATLPFDPSVPKRCDDFEMEMRAVLGVLIDMSHEALEEKEREAINERENPDPARKGPRKPSPFMTAYLRLQREIRAHYRFLRECQKDQRSTDTSAEGQAPRPKTVHQAHKGEKGVSAETSAKADSAMAAPKTESAQPQSADRAREDRAPSRQEPRPASTSTPPTGVIPAKAGTSTCDHAQPRSASTPEPESKPKPPQTPALPKFTRSGVPLYYPEGYRPKHPSDTNRREFLRTAVDDTVNRPLLPFNKPKHHPGLGFL